MLFTILLLIYLFTLFNSLSLKLLNTDVYVTLLYSNVLNNNIYANFEDALKFGKKHNYEQCKENMFHRIASIEKKLSEMITDESSLLLQLKRFNEELKEVEKER